MKFKSISPKKSGSPNKRIHSMVTAEKD